MIKYIILSGFVLCLALSVESDAQPRKFYVGMYASDHDGASDSVPPVELIGLDQAYLDSLIPYNFNLLVAANALNGQRVDTNNPANNPSNAFLDRAWVAGLDVLLNVPEMQISKTAPFYSAQTGIDIVNALDYYNDKRSLIGYMLTDEPCRIDFEALDSISQDILNYENSKLPFINLLPHYAGAYQLYNCNTDTTVDIPQDEFQRYRDYLDDFISTVQPKVLSVDYYPLYFQPLECNWPRTMYWTYDTLARAAQGHSIPHFFVISPFVEVLGSNSTGNPCGPRISWTVKNDEARYNYIIYSAMLFAPKALIYWAREVSTFENGWDVKVPQNIKEHVGQIHARLLDRGHYLLPLRYQNCYHTTDAGPISTLTTYMRSNMEWTNVYTDTIAGKYFHPGAPLYPANGPNFNNLVFTFLTDNAGGEYFWVFNKSIESSAGFSLTFNTGSGELDVADILGRRMCRDISVMAIHLAAGEGKLFQLRRSGPDTVYYGPGTKVSGHKETIMAHYVESSGAINITSGATVHALAYNIVLKPGFSAAHGSDVALTTYQPHCNESWRGIPPLPAAAEPMADQGLHIAVYPVPASETLEISVHGPERAALQCSLVTILGETVQVWHAQMSDGQYKYSLNVHDFPPGLYMLRVQAEDKFGADKVVILP